MSRKIWITQARSRGHECGGSEGARFHCPKEEYGGYQWIGIASSQKKYERINETILKLTKIIDSGHMSKQVVSDGPDIQKKNF